MANIFIFNILHAKTQQRPVKPTFYIFLSFPKKDAALRYTDKKTKFNLVQYSMIYYTFPETIGI